MGNMNHRYKEMYNTCEKYQKKIENLKNMVYGYNTSLDCIIPYTSEQFFEKKENCWGIEDFTNKIIDYCSALTEESSSWFKEEITENEKLYIRDLVQCILYYLKNACNYEDYTFLGLIKITKTFLDEYKDDYIPTKEDSTFWHLYHQSGIFNSQKCLDEIKVAFSNLYFNFDYYFAKKIAEKALLCIRFFLYDQKIDFMNDQVMTLVTLELIQEIENRLYRIYENRIPRKDDLTQYE